MQGAKDNKIKGKTQHDVNDMAFLTACYYFVLIFHFFPINKNDTNVFTIIILVLSLKYYLTFFVHACKLL